jgi:hypothetical protein
MPRGRSWGEKDDELLARAWVRVSRSPLDGIDQSADTFWSKFKAQFDATSSGDEERTAQSMKSRWNSTLRPDVSKFLNSEMYIERLIPTGASAGDRMQMAMRHFSGARYDDKGEIGVFNHHLALAVLRDEPRFAMQSSAGNVGGSRGGFPQTPVPSVVPAEESERLISDSSKSGDKAKFISSGTEVHLSERPVGGRPRSARPSTKMQKFFARVGMNFSKGS